MSLVVVEPSGSTRVGDWTVYTWPNGPCDIGLVAMRLPLPVRAGASYLRNGWQSWSPTFEDRLGGHVTRGAIDAPINHALVAPPYDGDESYDVIAVFQIDDGYQRAVGDWLDTNDRFPSGLATLARQVADAGFRPGLWTAPFIVFPQAKLAADHPDWFLRGRDGEPVWAAWNSHWGGNVYALDLSRPDVLGWVEELYRQLASLGFRYLKLDFLYAAAMEGDRAQASSGRECLRNGLAAVRRGAGDDAFLLGCGCPLWPAIGIVDGMRIGPYVAPYWCAGNQMLVLSDRFEDLDGEDIALWREISASSRSRRAGE